MILALLTTLAHLRGWTRTPDGWHAPHGLSPALLHADGWRHMTVGGRYVRVGSEAAALAWTALVPPPLVLWGCLVLVLLALA
jgi:hypothetical protein